MATKTKGDGLSPAEVAEVNRACAEALTAACAALQSGPDGGGARARTLQRVERAVRGAAEALTSDARGLEDALAAAAREGSASDG